MVHEVYLDDRVTYDYALDCYGENRVDYFKRRPKDVTLYAQVE